MGARPKYPLWYCISEEARQLLADYQWRHYGLKIIPPPFPVDDNIHIGDIEEIQRIMRQRRKGVVIR